MESTAVDPAIVQAAEIQMCRSAPKRLRPGGSDGDELLQGKRSRIAGGDTHRGTASNYVGMSGGTSTPLSRAFLVEADPHPWLAELRLSRLVHCWAMCVCHHTGPFKGYLVMCGFKRQNSALKEAVQLLEPYLEQETEVGLL
jgi:hypothetical protein